MDVKDLLKLNAKKLADTPRAFFYVEDKASKEKILHIDRKFNSPKRFSSLKKVMPMLQKVFELEVSKSSKFCAGLAFRDDAGTIVFQPVIQKANATLLKKGLKAFRKQLGKATVQMSGAPSTEDAADGVAENQDLSGMLDRLEGLLTRFEAPDTSPPDKTAIVPTALAAIDDYIVARSASAPDDAAAYLLVHVAGRSLKAWQDVLNSWDADQDSAPEQDQEVAETIAALEDEVRLAEEELERLEDAVTQSQQRIERANASVANQVLMPSLLNLLKGKDLPSMAALLSDEALQSKLRAVIDEHQDNTNQVELAQLDVALSTARVETEQARLALATEQAKVDEVQTRLTNTLLDQSLLATVQDRPLPDTANLSDKVQTTVHNAVSDREDAQDRLQSSEHQEVIISAQRATAEALQNLERLKEEGTPERRLQTRNYSTANLEGSHAEVLKGIADLRPVVRQDGGDTAAVAQLTELERLSASFFDLKELSVSIEGCSLRLSELSEDLQGLDTERRDQAVAALSALRTQLTGIEQSIQAVR